MKLRTLDQLDVENCRVLVRCDLNLSLLDNGSPADTTRIERLLPTVTELSARGARILLASHFGRPEGKVDPEFSISRLVDPIGETLGAEEIAIVGNCVGPLVENITRDLQPGGIALLENLRFHPGEEANDANFAKALACLGDVYLNDAFSVAHRAHASVVGVPALLPAAAGRAFETEVSMLESALGEEERPVMAIVGGGKVSTKIGLLRNLVRRVDVIAVGGALANTFLAARGHDLGRSRVEDTMLPVAREIDEAAKEANCELLLPTDAAVTPKPGPGADVTVVPVDSVPAECGIFDIGPETLDRFGNHLVEVRTVIWCGPLGLFEVEPFDQGTSKLARTVALLTRGGALRSVAGGGDTVAALNRSGLAGGFSYVSVAGGAFLQWVEGQTLPGVVPLTL